MRDTLSVIAEMVSVAGSLEEAIKLVDEQVEKGDCMPISKELRDKEVKREWAEKVYARRVYVISESVKQVLERKGTLADALLQVQEKEKSGSFESFPDIDMRDRLVIHSWVDAVKYQNTFFFRDLIDQLMEVSETIEEATSLVGRAMATPISREEVDQRISSAWQKREDTEKSLQRVLNRGK